MTKEEIELRRPPGPRTCCEKCLHGHLLCDLAIRAVDAERERDDARKLLKHAAAERDAEAALCKQAEARLSALEQLTDGAVSKTIYEGTIRLARRYRERAEAAEARVAALEGAGQELLRVRDSDAANNREYLHGADDETVAAADIAIAAEYAAAWQALRSALSGQPSAVERDAGRMDWLERYPVTVYRLTRYGTGPAIFHATPDLEDETSNLRAKVDAALAQPEGKP